MYVRTYINDIPKQFICDQYKTHSFDNHTTLISDKYVHTYNSDISINQHYAHKKIHVSSTSIQMICTGYAQSPSRNVSLVVHTYISDIFRQPSHAYKKIAVSSTSMQKRL